MNPVYCHSTVCDPHYYNFGFKLTSNRKIQPIITGRKGKCFWFFSPWSRVGHALRPIFMLWLVKIWQVSLCGKCLQHLETCLLLAKADRFLCHLVMFLTAFFHWIYKIKYSCCQDSSAIHGWFVYWVMFGWELRRLSESSEIWFFFFHLAWCLRVMKSLKLFWPYLIAFRIFISNGKPQ